MHPPGHFAIVSYSSHFTLVRLLRDAGERQMERTDAATQRGHPGGLRTLVIATELAILLLALALVFLVSSTTAHALATLASPPVWSEFSIRAIAH